MNRHSCYTLTAASLLVLLCSSCASRPPKKRRTPSTRRRERPAKPAEVSAEPRAQPEKPAQPAPVDTSRLQIPEPKTWEADADAPEIPAPVARYTFDAPFGFIEPNVAGAGHDALVLRNSFQHPMARRERGRFGNAIRRAERTNVQTTFPAEGDFTVSFWFHPEGLDANSMFRCGDLNVSIDRHKPVLKVRMRTAELKKSIELKRWTCVALNFDGKTMALYLDGALVGQTTATLSKALSGQKLTCVNTGGPHHQYAGLFDELRIYDDALTAEQMAAISDADKTLTRVPPEADAGVDHTLYLEDSGAVAVNLKGRVAGTRADGVSWSVMDRPDGAEVRLSTPTSLETIATFTAPGDYVLALRAINRFGPSVDTTRVVVFPPHPRRAPGKPYANPRRPGPRYASDPGIKEENRDRYYTVDFAKKQFPDLEPRHVMKGFAKDRFRKPPPPYQHPRIFFDHEDLWAMRHRLRYTKAGRAAVAKVRMMYDMSTRGRGGVPGDFYANGKASFDPGARYCIGAYLAMVDADTALARRLIEGAARCADHQLAALRKLSPEKRAGWQHAPHNILARYTTSYVYDFLYPWMTRAEQDKLREVISLATSGVHSIGMYAVPRAHGSSNWVCWVTGDLVANILAIEGEDGFDPVVYAEAARAMRNFVTYGIKRDGSSYEGMGKNSLTAQNLMAMAKRGDYALRYENVHNFYVRFMLNVMQPFGEAFISDDLWGSSRYGGLEADAAVMKFAYPDEPVIDFVYRNVVKGDEYYTRDFRTTYGYTNPLINCMVGTDWEGDADWSVHAKQALQGQPLDAHFNYTNIATARSAWEKDAAYLYFLPRMLGGHKSPARGTFVFSALGRDWSEYPTGHNDKHSLQHSVITVDGASAGRQNARMCGYDSSEARMIAAADLRDVYAHRDDPTRSLNDFRLEPAPEPWNSLPEWQLPHWQLGDTRSGSRPPDDVAGTLPASARSAYRVVALVREKRPYALIVDDFDLDGQSHRYRWQMVLPRGLQAEVRGSDIIVSDPDTGKLVLVRPLEGRDKVAASIKEEKGRVKAVAFEATAVSLTLNVLLMAFEKGATVPPASFQPPRLAATLREMTALLDREKETVRQEEKRQMAAVREKLKGFTPAGLGKPLSCKLGGEPASRVPGLVGQALKFEGGKGVSLEPAPPFKDKAPFTLAFWVKILKAEGSLYTSNGNRGLSMSIFQGGGWKVSTNGNWYWARGDNSRARSKWGHIAFTCDGTTLRFYENGGLRKEDAVSTFRGSPRARIGDGFGGLIDDLRIYDKAIAGDDLRKLYLYQRYGIGRK